MSAEDSVQEEIIVPPQLIRVLKEYTKAVVRAKPSDLLLWSAVYFRTLASGQSPEKNERLHIFDPAAGGLSQAVIRLMYLKLKEKETVVIGDLKSLWKELGLDSSLLLELFSKCAVPQEEAESEVNWMKILALATAMTSEDLKDTMRKFVEAVGGTSETHMPLPVVEEIFQFLAEVNDVPSSDFEGALQHLREIGRKQGGYVSSVDFQDSTFPNL